MLGIMSEKRRTLDLRAVTALAELPAIAAASAEVASWESAATEAEAAWAAAQARAREGDLLARFDLPRGQAAAEDTAIRLARARERLEVEQAQGRSAILAARRPALERILRQLHEAWAATDVIAAEALAECHAIAAVVGVKAADPLFDAVPAAFRPGTPGWDASWREHWARSLRAAGWSI